MSTPVFIQVTQICDDGSRFPQFINLSYISRIVLEMNDKGKEEVVAYICDPKDGEMCIKLSTPMQIVGEKLVEAKMLIAPKPKE